MYLCMRTQLCGKSLFFSTVSYFSLICSGDNDPWDWLAKLMNILEALDDKTIEFESEMKEGRRAKLPTVYDARSKSKLTFAVIITVVYGSFDIAAVLCKTKIIFCSTPSMDK